MTAIARRFVPTVKRVGTELLGPHGFQFLNEGAGLVVFCRKGRPGLLEGIVIYRSSKLGGFTVEIGVVPEDSHFGWALSGESGTWRELGLRVRLGKLTHGESFEGDLLERDFVGFEDELGLEAGLRRELAQALFHAPTGARSTQ